MDDFEVTYHGGPPERVEKSLGERVGNWLYYYGCCLFLMGGIVITPVVAILIVSFNRAH